MYTSTKSRRAHWARYVYVSTPLVIGMGRELRGRSIKKSSSSCSLSGHYLWLWGYITVLPIACIFCLYYPPCDISLKKVRFKTLVLSHVWSFCNLGKLSGAYEYNLASSFRGAPEWGWLVGGTVWFAKHVGSVIVLHSQNTGLASGN